MQKRFFIRPGLFHPALVDCLPRADGTAESNIFNCVRFFLAALLAAGSVGGASAAEAGRQVLRGHVPAVTKRLKSIGRMESAVHLDLSIGLPLRNREGLTNLLQGLYQPSDPNFRHYVTPAQFASSYGPSQEDYQAVIDFAKAHGLTVKGTHPNRTLLDVSGSVGDIEKAFHVKMQLYQHPTEARKFFAPDVEPSLDLATPVLAISGLDSYVRPRQRRALASLTNSPRPLVRPLRGGGPGGGGGGGGGSLDGGYGGYDFRNAYVPNLSQDGTGQSLALFELAGYAQDDIDSYQSESGLVYTGSISNIYIDGATGYDGSGTSDEDLTLMDYYVEVTGDIEMAMAMAPGVNILVYEGPTPLYEAPAETNFVQYASVTAQVNDVLNRMATDNLAKQISSSYILDINLSTIQIYQQFAAQGQSFFQGSGDFGAYPGFIDAPADDPYLTVVGGTTLNTDSGGNWASEIVWLTPPQSDGLGDTTPLQASGGGISLTYPIPDYQLGISMTANQGSTTMRNLPDVALVADNITVVFGNDYYGGLFVFALGSDEFPTGGTSLATPLWAGFMAMVNQASAAEGKPPVGFANPAVYAIGKSTNYNASFHDVTSGNDFNPNSPSKYSATIGYDLCTGWGTINSNLLNALLNPPVDSLLVTPPLGFTSVGPGGGPYTKTSQTYAVKNNGTTALSWSLSNSAAWLTVTPTSGSLNPGASTTVSASLNAAANNFMIGHYSADVAFSNLTSGTYQNRQFDMYAGNGGFETGDFTFWSMVGDTNSVFTLEGDDTNVAGTNAMPGVADDVFVHAGLYGAYLGESPDDGSLAQTLTTQPGQVYSVSFWLTSVAYQGETTPNDFSAKWNGTNMYAQTNLAAFGWTNLQFVVRATAGQTTLQFKFANDPAAFALDDVTVEPAPRPTLQAATITGGNITFTWSAMANFSYQIQVANTLSNPNWTNVGGTVTANGSLASASEPVDTGSSQQFYRVVLMLSQ